MRLIWVNGGVNYDGFVSSHFFFLRRQVIQPVLDLPLVILIWPPGTGSGCLRGRPRFRGTLTGAAVGVVVQG